MNFNDEKDYIMRIIKEMVRVLFSLMFGKQYKSVELEDENKYEVSGKKLSELKEMVDEGLINEAENMIYDGIDYARKEEIAAALLFYQYIGEKDNDFLAERNYSKEEALDGIRRLTETQGYNDILALIVGDEM